MFRTTKSVGLLCAMLLVGSCENGTPPGAFGPPAAVVILEGQDLTGVVGKEMTTALSVQVVDSAGNPVAGQVVNFRVTFGGGSVFAGAAATNANGIAKERWTLGTVAADSQRLEARAVDASTGTAIVFATFRADAVADAPASVTKVSGDGQAVTAGTAAADSLVVRIADQYQNPVSGATVTWTAGAQSGSVSPSTSTTDAAGLAATRWTVGTTDGVTQQVSATTGSLPGVTFGANVVGAAATNMVIVTPAAGANSGQAFTTQPVIRLVDANGNTDPTANQAVAITVSAGGAMIGTATVSAVQGIASFSNVGVSGPPANYTLTYSAFVGGSTKTLTQAILVTNGPPSAYAVTTPSNSVVVGTSFVVTAQLLDAGGNSLPLASRTVTWSNSNAYGGFSSPTSTTDAQGRATVTFTVDTKLGAPTTRMTATDQSGVTGSKDLAVTSGPPVGLFFFQQPSSRGWGLRLRPVIVRVVDQYNNPVRSDSRTINIGLAAGSGPMSGTTSLAAVDGVATFDNLVPTAPGSGFQLSASDATGQLPTVSSNSFFVDNAGTFDSTSEVRSGPVLFDGRVYYVLRPSTNLQVRSVSTTGGPTQLVATLTARGVGRFFIQDGFIHVLQVPGDIDTLSRIHRIPVAGGPSTALSLDDSQAVICNADQDIGFDGTYYIVICKRTQGPSRQLYRIRASDGERLLLATGVNAFVISSGFVYYTVGTEMRRVPIDASAPSTTHVTGLLAPSTRERSIIVEGNRLLWVETATASSSTESALRTAPLAGGAASTATSLGTLRGYHNLIVDGETLWLAWGGGPNSATEDQGGVSRRLLSDFSGVPVPPGACCSTQAFTFDSNALYFRTGGIGAAGERSIRKSPR